MNFRIENKKIGPGNPLLFIAEAGVNHNGSIEIGKGLIDAAVDAGADVIKFQTFKAKNIILPDGPKAQYHIETTGSDSEQSWYDLLKEQEISYDMHIELIEYCKKKNIIFMSTPYDKESADLLESLNVSCYKIASTDTNNYPLLKHIAKKGVPMIISTAMSTFEEVSEAFKVVKDTGLNDIAVLQCTGNYPSKLEDSNLRVMNTYRETFQCPIGYSDHTPQMINPISATAMGANIFEKHFTLDKKSPGPDHRMSLEPDELKQTIKLIRETEMALGTDKKNILEVEKNNRLNLRKSVVAIKDIKEGQAIDLSMIDIKRPGTGLEPKNYEIILGKNSKVDIKKDTVIEKDFILW
jgi:N,N'-diacetyllegionaminate synthase